MGIQSQLPLDHKKVSAITSLQNVCQQVYQSVYALAMV